MIDIASRATNGVKIPGRKATRNEIKSLFKKHLTDLKARLNVGLPLYFCQTYLMSWTLQSPAVSGKINLTCDAWQAGNTEGYFAVTGHWIEESTPSHWELKSALLGFTQVNNAHNGKRLGQALFKIVERVGIEHKVSTASYFVDIYRLIKHRFRLVTSLATTPRITAQC
jgi:hypothetical protein